MEVDIVILCKFEKTKRYHTAIENVRKDKQRTEFRSRGLGENEKKFRARQPAGCFDVGALAMQ